MTASPWARWEPAAMAACAGAFVLLRLPLYTSAGVILGWHSDAALLGLMARAMATGDIPWIFWSSDYLAPLTSLFAAAVGLLLREIGPLALRLGTAVEVVAALVFYHAALRRVAGPRAALLATAWLAAGPPFLFKLTYVPLSAEQAFFLGGVILWYAVRAPFDRPHRWLLLGLLAGVSWWIHRGALFAVMGTFAGIALFDRRRLRAWQLAAGAAIFAAGALLGTIPKIIGRYGVDQPLYAPLKAPWAFMRLAERVVDTVTHDVWMLLGAETPLFGWLAGALFAVLLVSAAAHFEIRRETVIAAATVLACCAVWVLSPDAYRGAVRYIIVAVPLLAAFAAGEIVRLWDARLAFARPAAAALALLIAAAYYVPAQRQVAAVAAAQREVYENRGGFDPRPALRAIAAGGYRVCYADVWVAHKLEWLSRPTVRVIPYRSVNRRMVESLRLAAEPGPKCFIDSAGSVRTLTPAEERAFRLDLLRQLHVRRVVWALHGTNGLLSSPPPALPSRRVV